MPASTKMKIEAHVVYPESGISIDELITKLSILINSPQYQQLLYSNVVPDDKKMEIAGIEDKRNLLVSKLFKIANKEIEGYNEEFKKLLGEMKSVNQSLSRISNELNQISDRIGFAVQIASGLDALLQLAIEIAGIVK